MGRPKKTIFDKLNTPFPRKMTLSTEQNFFIAIKENYSNKWKRVWSEEEENFVQNLAWTLNGCEGINWLKTLNLIMYHNFIEQTTEKFEDKFLNVIHFFFKYKISALLIIFDLSTISFLSNLNSRRINFLLNY